jgi:HD-like signal output (HDOD) protein
VRISFMKPTQAQFLQALARIEGFSPAPRVLAKALRLLRDPISDVGSVAALIGSDPALAAEILRCANSAYFRHGSPVGSIVDAVQKIGIRETVRRLNVAVARMLTGTDLKAYGVSGDAFWAESLMHGLFLYEVAERTGHGDPDEAYTAGLLRFIGRLAIDRLAFEYQRPRTEGVTFSDWEQNTVGFLHSQAGALLLAKWQFLDHLVQAIAGQDHPERLSQSNWLADALHFAASVLPSDGPGTATAEPRLEVLLLADDGFMQNHGLTIDDVGRLLATTREAFGQVQSSF